MLGAAYHLGAGVARDPVSALMWLLRGQYGGSQLATPFIDPVRASMNDYDKERAKKLAEMPLPEPVSSLSAPRDISITARRLWFAC